ncbi:MAG: ABC transporter permease [Planctomycetes bacterium]|nr:ABC transporter permease [Planctomycetota bacterium]
MALRYLPFLRRNLLRNRRRSFLTLFSLAASIFLVVVLEGLLRHLDDMPRADGSEKRLIVRNAQNFKDPIPASFGGKIHQIPGVQGVCALFLYWGIYKDLKPEYFFPKMALDAERLRENYPETRIVDPETGAERPALFDQFVADRRGASAGINLYRKYGWKIGDRIVFRGMGLPDVEVTLRSCYDGPERSSFYFHRAYLEELMGNPGAVTFFNVICENAEDLPSVASSIDALFANSQAPTVTETEKAFQGQWVQMLGNVRFLLRAIGLACGFAMLCVSANTLAMTARERASEIAVMKTLGFTPGKVLTLLLSEVAVLCAIASAIGSGGAVAMFLFPGPWHDMGGGFLLGMRIPPDLAIAALPLGIFVGWASALWPFLRVAHAPIASTIRRTG